MNKTINILINFLLLANLTPGSDVSAQDISWTLEKCISYALEQNIDVRKSLLTNKSAVLNAEQAKALRFPSVNGSVDHNFRWSKSNASAGSGFYGSNVTSYSVNSGVTLFNYSRINNLIKQAELEIQSGIYTLEATKESVSLGILNAFLQVLYAREQVNNSRKQIESTESQVFLAGERLALKINSQADYAQVRSQLAGEKLILANAESHLAIARVNLMQLMELPVTDDFTIVQSGESSIQNRIPDVKTVYETALAIKPHVRNASVLKEIAAISENIARSGYYPVLSASAGIGTSYSSINTGSYFSQVNNGIQPGVGFSLSIPVYRNRQLKTSVALSRIALQDAGLDEINTKNQLRKDIEQACQEVASSRIEYEASLQKYDAAYESSILSDEKFRQGLINPVDYLVQKTNLIVAESQLLQSKYNLIFSYKILDFYMGVPLTL